MPVSFLKEIFSVQKVQHNGQQITGGTVAGTYGQEKIIKDYKMDSKTKTPFQLFIFPEAMMSEVVFVTICLDFCAHFFFGVPHIILIFCDQCLMVQVATVHKFSCVFFCFFSSFSFPPPVFHCCAGE